MAIIIWRDPSTDWTDDDEVLLRRDMAKRERVRLFLFASAMTPAIRHAASVARRRVAEYMTRARSVGIYREHLKSQRARRTSPRYAPAGASYLSVPPVCPGEGCS